MIDLRISTTLPMYNSLPTVPQLSTPTDLNRKDLSLIVDSINVITADTIAFYLKIKNFHWHVTGSHFRDYHLMFDDHASEVFSSIDDLAERARKLGGSTIRGISQVAALQTIKDNLEPFVEPKDMITELVRDNLHIAASLRELHGLCDAARDIGTSQLLEILIDQTEKRKWFLYSTLQTPSNS